MCDKIILMKLVKSVISNDQSVSFKDVKNWYERNLHPDVLDLDDPKPYECYEKGRFAGLFQFTAKGAQNFVRKIKPKNIIDIATATSIYRPGPLAAKVDDIYIDAKNDPENIKYEHPLVKRVLEPTFNCVTGDAVILTDEGYVTLEQLASNMLAMGTKIPSFNEETREIEQDEIVAVVETGIKPVLCIETEDGRTLELTDDHRVFTGRGWVFAKDLTLNDEILTIND